MRILQRHIVALVNATNKLHSNRLVFEQCGKHWELADNQTGHTTIGNIGECYSEAHRIWREVSANISGLSALRILTQSENETIR